MKILLRIICVLYALLLVVASAPAFLVLAVFCLIYWVFTGKLLSIEDTINILLEKIEQ